MKNKIFNTFEEAIADVQDGARIMMFNWALGRSTPRNLIRAVFEKGTKDLTIISHNFAPRRIDNYIFDDAEAYSPTILVDRAKKVITAFTGPPFRKNGEIFSTWPKLEKRLKSGEVEIELMSHGTLAQRIRAGGSGIGGFYTPVGVGTIVEKGKEKRVIDGKEYILEKPLRADFGFIRAYKADKRGNLVYRGSVRGGNPVLATACDVAIAEVDEIVEVGELDPDVIVTPGICVHRIVKIPEGGVGSPPYMESLFHKALSVLQENSKG